MIIVYLCKKLEAFYLKLLLESVRLGIFHHLLKRIAETVHFLIKFDLHPDLDST